MTEDQVRDILRAANEEKAARAADMPDDDAAMRSMHRAFQRLRDLGWSDAIYSPKDGTVFEALEAGCVVPGRCHYMGEWPKGGWWMHSNNDLWPSRPILWREVRPDRSGEGWLPEMAYTNHKNNSVFTFDGETGELKEVAQVGKPSPAKMEALLLEMHGAYMWRDKIDEVLNDLTK